MAVLKGLVKKLYKLEHMCYIARRATEKHNQREIQLKFQLPQSQYYAKIRALNRTDRRMI
jgi:hypothetical protein